MTSPKLFASVCILLQPLCFAPETFADVHPGPRPLLVCAVHHWVVETATSAWAASAGLQVTSESRENGINITDVPDGAAPACHDPTTYVSILTQLESSQSAVCCSRYAASEPPASKQQYIHYFLQVFYVWQLPQKQHLLVPRALRSWAVGVRSE